MYQLSLRKIITPYPNRRFCGITIPENRAILKTGLSPSHPDEFEALNYAV